MITTGVSQIIKIGHCSPLSREMGRQQLGTQWFVMETKCIPPFNRKWWFDGCGQIKATNMSDVLQRCSRMDSMRIHNHYVGVWNWMERVGFVNMLKFVGTAMSLMVPKPSTLAIQFTSKSGGSNAASTTRMRNFICWQIPVDGTNNWQEIVDRRTS